MAYINIGGTLHSVATGNIVAESDEIFDKEQEKRQSEINEDVANINENYLKEGENIGPSDIPDFDTFADTVHVTPQTLSKAQQQQVMDNLGMLGFPYPFKGWWPDLDTLKAKITATPGDYAYIFDVAPATTASIYVYDETATSNNCWADSGRDVDASNVNSFASGQALNTVHIVNNSITGGDNDVLSAEQGKVLSGAILDEYKQQNTIHITSSDAHISPIAYTANYYWQITTSTNIGDVVALNSSSTTGAHAYKFAVIPGMAYNISGRKYNKNRYFVAYVDENMKLIAADALMENTGTEDFSIDIVIPVGAKYLLVNSYSNNGIVIGKELYKAASDDDVNAINVKEIYNEVRYLPVNTNLGYTYNVGVNTPIGEVLSAVSATGWYYDIIEVRPGEVYRYYFRATKNSNRFFVLLVDSGMRLVKALCYKNPSETVEYFTEYFTVPNDPSIKYAILCYSGWTTSAGQQSSPLLDKINDTSVIKSMIEQYVSPDIATLNKDIECNVNAAANWIPVYGYAGESQNMKKYFAIHMITDIHQDSVRFDRYCKYLESMQSIDAGICLGDITDNFANNADWYTDAVNALSKPYLTVIGNHDAGNTNKIETSGTTAQCFTKFIQPTLSRIGLPTLDKTYYCRTFDEYKVAVIVLNVHDLPDTMLDANTFAVSRGIMAMSQTQVDWLISTLGSIPNDYHVMLCYHYTDDWAEYVDGNFTFKRYSSGHMGYLGTMAAYQGVVGAIVNAWKHKTTINTSFAPVLATDYLPTLNVVADYTARTASHFIGHFCGHAHGDDICRFEDYTDQYVFYWGWGYYSDNYTSSPIYGDTPRLKGTRSEDLTTLVAVDVSRSAVNIVRIGANTTVDMVNRTMLRIKYEE